MENIKTCELCLGQVIKTEDVENLNCDENQNLKILKNLEITVSKDAKVCSNCVKVSNLMYNFKMSCLTNNDHLKILIHPDINDKLILEEVIVKNTKTEFKNEEKVCRFCLNFSEVNSLVGVNLEQDVVLKDMLQRCLPEIDTNIVQNPLICYICSELLEKLYSFISQCENTEVLRNLDTKTDVRINENTSTVTVANNNENIEKIFVKEENCEGIENPELQIKSEDTDIDEDPLNVSNPVAEKDVTPKPCGRIKEKKFVCDICPYQTNRNDHLKEHYVTHKEPSEVNLFKCEYCPFVTKWKNNLTQHTKRHKNPSELVKFKCKDCQYETIRKSQLARHALVHKKPSEVIMYKCKVCPYQTKYRDKIQIHEKTHQVEIYACDECNYKTKLKRSFVIHLRYHKEWKQPAKSNQNPKNVKEYKCKECSYVGTRNSHLIEHQMIHKDPSEREMYNCTECSFQALYKISLKKHYKKNHSDLEVPFEEIKIFRCNECIYATAQRRDILKHLQTHEQERITPSVKEELQEQNNMQDKGEFIIN